MNPANDKRRYARHAAQFSAKYSVKEGTFRDLIRNIGAGGIFINSRRMIKRNQTISIRFPTFAFENRFYATGMVVRCSTDGFAVMFNEPIEEKLSMEGRFPGFLSERDR